MWCLIDGKTMSRAGVFNFFTFSPVIGLCMTGCSHHRVNSFLTLDIPLSVISTSERFKSSSSALIIAGGGDSSFIS